MLTLRQLAERVLQNTASADAIELTLWSIVSECVRIVDATKAGRPDERVQHALTEAADAIRERFDLGD